MQQPNVDLPAGWAWQQRFYCFLGKTNWAATSDKGTVWCDGCIMWDTCSEPFPIDVAYAVLKANKL